MSPVRSRSVQNKFALIALEHDAPCDGDVLGSFVACLERTVRGANFTKGVSAIKPIRIWVGALRAKGSDVVESACHLGGETTRGLDWVEIVAVFG